MFCKNCGAPVEPGIRFCKQCGCPANRESLGRQNSLAGDNSYNDSIHNASQVPHVAYVPPTPVTPINPVVTPMVDTRTMTPARRRGTSPVLYVALGVAIALLLALLAVLIVKGGLLGGTASVNKNEITLQVEDYPSTTDQQYYNIEGTISSKGGTATLSLDGGEIDTVTEEEGEKYWQTEVYLQEGTNEFELTLSDEDGNTETRKVVIRYEHKLRYPAGTKLIKYETRKLEGIIIRSEASTYGTAVCKIKPYAYYDTMICRGKEQIGDDGFLWINVDAPNGQIGWVREDVVQIAY